RDGRRAVAGSPRRRSRRRRRPRRGVASARRSSRWRGCCGGSRTSCPEVYTAPCMNSQWSGGVFTWWTGRGPPGLRATPPSRRSGAVQHPLLQRPAPLVGRQRDGVVLEGDAVTVHRIGEDPSLDRTLGLPVGEGHRAGLLEGLGGVVPLVPVVVLLVERVAVQVLRRVDVRRSDVRRVCVTSSDRKHN